uniref:E3 ubiquitin-protein ligase MARCHF6-like n=1 Tax=Styela clava TaxID=7725 RepID=UPI00193A62FB|nr:E3 ubiquitin-protein ligase MARCHF6-like [Styela clava]
MASVEESDYICRVCRSEGSQDKPLYHPCICTGSIRYVHQDCLVQWLRHSKKEYCELCKHKYSFKPIYSADMPTRLPVTDLVYGLFRSIFMAVRSWLHYTLVAVAWLGIVPLTACRIYKCLFTGSVRSLLSLPMDMLSTENVGQDILCGSLVVACTMASFIGLVWLREQIMNGGMPGWLNRNGPDNVAVAPNAEVAINDDNNNVEHGVPNAEDIAEQEEDESDDSEDIDEEEEDAEPEEIQLDGAEVEDLEENEVDVQNEGDDGNWNALEWDRAAEELTWERMLGLDGSLVFLEHVFWVVSLNTLFILVFAFCPYHLGHFVLAAVDLDVYLVASRFEGFLTTLFGYVILTVAFFVCHAAMFLLKMQRSGRVLGILYIVLKVALLVMFEMGVFPLVCGWWLDICSLQLFNTTVQERVTNYINSPGTSTFFHWLLGMIYIFYTASFMLLLKEVLRPGALWFLRNLNDPDFNPIQEMIHLPLYRHIRRFLLSVVIFGSAVLMMIYLPVQMILRYSPNFLPYHVNLRKDVPISDLSLELILLQVIIPALLEQGQTRQWLKSIIKIWAKVVGTLLGVKSYLLGDTDGDARAQNENQIQPQQAVNNNDENQEEVPVVPFQQQNLHPEPQQMALDGEIHQPYTRPNYFVTRIVLLLLLMCATLSLISLTVMVVPVGIGRYLFSLWLGTENANFIHDLYPTALGLYTCWLMGHLVNLSMVWFPRGSRAIWSECKTLIKMISKIAIVGGFVFGLFPLLFGLLFELVIVIPLRVPLHQSPLNFLWQDWVLGILLVKLAVALTLLGPQWKIRIAIERVFHQGPRNFSLRDMYVDVIHPIMCSLLLSLTVPYVIAHSATYVLGLPHDFSNILLRRIYPCLISFFALVSFLMFEAKQFRRLCDHIKNERYLVGKRLLNYEPAKA